MTPAEKPASTFGPSALATPANLLTFARILVTPILVAMIISTGPSSWPLVCVWFVSASSDILDGYLARKQGATRSGAFLDPLADKCLVLGALVALAVLHEVSWLPVALISAREVAMSLYRIHAGRRGVSIPARQTAKLKTFMQDLAVGLALLPPVGLHHVDAVRIVLWVAVVLTLYTGIEYLYDGRRLLAAASSAGSAASTISSAPAASAAPAATAPAASAASENTGAA